MNAAAPVAGHSGSRSSAHEIDAHLHAPDRHAGGADGGVGTESKRLSTDSIVLSQEGQVSAAREGDPDVEEMRALEDLKARDREVRAHEAAHKTAGGQYAGAVHLDFTTGPDGQRYAVGGEVQIDTAPVAGDPEATIEKMRIVQAAAMAPANPSAADRAVAAKAAQTAMDARIEADRVTSEKSKESRDRPEHTFSALSTREAR